MESDELLSGATEEEVMESENMKIRKHKRIGKDSRKHDA